MSTAWAAAEDELDDAIASAAVDYADLPVSSHDPAESGDYVPDPHGGRIRMGAQPGWSPAREGYEAPPRPPRLTRRWKMAGRVTAQSPMTCTECGGIVPVASDRLTREPSLYVFRSAIDPSCPPLGPEQTCGGCLRQGVLLAGRVSAAAVARQVAEARRADPDYFDPWLWTRAHPATPEAPAGQPG